MASKPIPSLDEEPEDEGWLVTYADAITLLMAFFVMLISFSKIDLPTFDEVMAGIQDKMGNKEYESPSKTIKEDLEEVVYEMGADQAVLVGKDDRGVTMELAGSAFFMPGSAILREEALPFLASTASSLMIPKYTSFLIEIEGHTDDDPISSVQFPSNWELSTSRSSAVVRFFIEQGMETKRLKATGYGETRPKLPNRDRDGTPIPQNKKENRRIVMRIYPMSVDERKEAIRAKTIEGINEEAAAHEAGPEAKMPSVPGEQKPAALPAPAQ